MLKQLFYKFINEYENEFEFKNAKKSIKNFSVPFLNLVQNDIVNEIINVIDDSTYSVEGRIGKGSATKVPYIFIPDTRITKSPQKGVYIVYLLNKDTKTLYLTLNQGATDVSKSVGEKKNDSTFTSINSLNGAKAGNALSQNASAIRNALKIDSSLTIGSIDSGNSAYDAGCICYKKYTLSNLPNDEELYSDLDTFISIYKDYYYIFVSGTQDTSAELHRRLTKEQWLEVLNNKDITYDNNLEALACLYDNGGKGSCTEIGEKYNIFMAQIRTGLGFHFASRVANYFGITVDNDKKDSKFFPILFSSETIKDDTPGSYILTLHPEIYEALTEFDITRFLKKSHPTGKFDSWEIFDENTAIKTCDKSFFAYTGSGVPSDICWFFDAENLQAGESKQLKLIYDGAEFVGYVRNDTTDRRRIQIRWYTNLASKLGEYENDDDKAVFTKISDNTYQITMNRGEMKLSTKDIVKNIKDYIAAKGFSYDDGLIENFYLSLKSKPFVILAGTSGTGKTKLVKLFAEAIGAEYKLVSVRPDWSDGSDLFGHYDLNGNFIEGPVCECFDTAISNPDKPVFLCLDEMNLARVEYYLSDFLSVIESREMQLDGTITTTSIAQYAEGIPENLYIIGTVNMDETTFPFSKKVLDRANTIEFSYVDLIPVFDDEESDVSKQPVSNDFLKTEYLVLTKDCANEAEYVVEICSELQRINEILSKANAHVGYRVRDEIVFYMINNKAQGELISHDAALDNEIMQKILPRIQGSSASVKNMLCELFTVCASAINQKTGDSDSEKMQKVLDDSTINKRYLNSAKKIAMMVQRFEEDGFTSYWL